MSKAIREAKTHTSWIHENAEYSQAVSRFVTESLEGTHATRFLASFLPFQRQVAHAGMMNALAQLILKVASPGVPDFYQGVELWDLSLVDPDNRRPVDFAARASILESLLPALEQLESGQAVAGDVSELVDRWPDGRIKLFVTAAALRFRRAHQELLLGGEYHPLVPQGASADHLVGFARSDHTGVLLVIVPRLSMSLTLDDRSLPRGRDAWGATRIPLPDFAGTRFRHVLTGEIVNVVDGGIAPMDAFRTLPGALLWQETRGTVRGSPT
jgi:(1->4)-alpha-D-glucan 1-alpha-D-glucosylmutase